MTTTNTSFADLPSSRTPEYIPVGIPGLLAATQKALGMNRGEMEEDQRDGQQFKRVWEAPDLMVERIKLDTGRIQRTALRHAARHRSLKGLMPGAFTPLVEKHLVSNQLSSPLEEINPLDLMNQNLRVTLMGPGGIGSMDAVTGSMQAIHPSSFGFLSAIEGPECLDELSEVYTQRGWVRWPDVEDGDIFACQLSGRLEWHQASRIVRESYTGQMIVGENESIRMCVTPNHRVFHRANGNSKVYKMATAEQVYGRFINIPITHAPVTGDETITHFSLPDIPVTNNNQKVYKPLCIGDWAEFVGWWLAEGSSSEAFNEKAGYSFRSVVISQCSVANPGKFARIRDLMIRLGFITEGRTKSGRALGTSSKQVFEYFRKWENGCYDKWVPAECFAWPVAARRQMLEALLLGDGRYNKKRICYCTVSYRLACSVEKLAISLGYPAFIRVEQDSRPHVKTTNYCVSISRAHHRSLKGYSNKHSNGKQYGDYWSKIAYSGMVYCATVPGGLLLVRGKPGTAGFWTGNSSLAGIDTRISNGAKIGSNGRIYQQFRNRRTGDIHWLSSPDLANSVVALPQS